MDVVVVAVVIKCQRLLQSWTCRTVSYIISSNADVCSSS